MFDNADLNPAFRFADRLNNRAKANAVVGNISSAINQFANIPNATAYLKNPPRLGAGLTGVWKCDHRPHKRDRTGHEKKSGLLQERYGIDKALNAFDEGILSKPRKFLNWMLTFGDEQAARSIWATACKRAPSGAAWRTPCAADDITKESHCRSRYRRCSPCPTGTDHKNPGALPGGSKQFVESHPGKAWREGRDWPYQPCRNLVHVQQSYVENIPGNRPCPIWWMPCRTDCRKAREKPHRNSCCHRRASGGEIISAMPYGAMAGSMLTGGDDSLGEKLFGDSDPTRFGTGVVGPTALAKPIGQLATGQAIDPIQRF